MPVTVPNLVSITSGNGAVPLGQSKSLRLHARLVSVARRCLTSVAVWVLYVPHYAVLKVIGPRYGLVWVRMVARLHYLLTFVGAQRATRQVLTQMHRYFDTKLSISEILRKHLEMKHECFARVRVYNMHGATTLPKDIHWEINQDSPAGLPQMEGRTHGLVMIGFHFGFFQMATPALSQSIPGCNPIQLRLSNVRHTEVAIPTIERLASRKAFQANLRSEAAILYVGANIPLFDLYCILRDGGSVLVAADGMLADHYVEVPFLDGMLRVPTGWARLAAITQSDVLIVCDQEIDRHRRDSWLFDHVQCRGNSEAAAYRAVTETFQVLERMIRQQPWGWHPWQRLRCQIGADGIRHYELQPYGRSLPWPRSGNSYPTSVQNHGRHRQLPGDVPDKAVALTESSVVN